MLIMLERYINRLQGTRKQQFMDDLQKVVTRSLTNQGVKQCNGACGCKKGAEA